MIRARVIEARAVQQERFAKEKCRLYANGAMQPAQIWERSGRLAIIGDEMFRLRDRRGAELVLGFTHSDYAHMTMLPEATRQALAEDFD